MTQYIIVPKTKSTFKCGMQLRDWKTKEDDLHLWNNRNPYWKTFFNALKLKWNDVHEHATKILLSNLQNKTHFKVNEY